MFVRHQARQAEYDRTNTPGGIAIGTLVTVNVPSALFTNLSPRTLPAIILSLNRRGRYVLGTRFGTLTDTYSGEELNVLESPAETYDLSRELVPTNTVI